MFRARTPYKPGCFGGFSRAILCLLAALTTYLQPQTGSAQDAQSADVLTQIKSGDEGARRAAIERLDPSATSNELLQALREMYLSDGSEQIRRAARVALARLSRNRPTARAASRPFAFHAPPPKRDIINAALPGGAFGRLVQFDRDDYKPPKPPTERVAQLIEQLEQDPAASVRASADLSKLGSEAIPASRALINVMMREQNNWHDARIAATEALEKINPELQRPVWKIIVERSTDMAVVAGSLADIAILGPRGYPAMPVVLAYWNAPEETGYRVEPFLLQTMHVIALRDPAITNEIVRVLKGDVSVGGNTLRYAIDICNERELPPEQIVELLTPYVLKDEPPGYAMNKLMELVDKEFLSPEPVVTLLVTLLERDVHPLIQITHLGHLGPAAEDALPLLKRFKFEHQDQRVRKAAESAMNLIDR